MNKDQLMHKVAKDVIDALRSTKGMGVEVDYVLSENNYNNRNFDDFLNIVMDCLEHQDWVADYNQLSPIYNDARAYGAALDEAMKMSICHYIANIDPRMLDKLTPSTADNVIKHAERLLLMLDDLHANEISPVFLNNDTRRRSNSRPNRRGTPLNNDRSGVIGGGDRRGSSNTSRNRSGSSREMLDRRGRGDRGMRNDNGYVREQMYYGDNEDYQPEPQPRRRTSSDINDNNEPVSRSKEVEIVDSRKSAISLKQSDAELFNPSTHCLYQIASGNTVTEKLDLRKSNMEPYSEHELGQSPYNKNSGNGKVIPTVNLLSLPPLGDDENIKKETNVSINDEVVVNNRSFKVDMTSDLYKLIGNTPYTITPIRNIYTMTIPTEAIKLADIKLEENKTFNDWKVSLDKLKECLTKENNRGGLLTTFMSVVDERLKELVNTLLAILVPVPARINHFQHDFDECWAYLSEPKNSRIFTAWVDCERALVASGISVAEIKPAKDKESGNSIVVFENKLIYVNAYGEIPQENIVFNDQNKVADVTYDRVPEFYTACDRIIAYRNNHCKMATVMLVDSFNNKYSILAGPVGATRIRAMQLSN